MISKLRAMGFLMALFSSNISLMGNDKIEVSLDEYLEASEEHHYVWTDLPSEVQVNVVDLLVRVNLLREKVPYEFIVDSGYRSPEHNKAVGGAPDSAHVTGQAIDIRGSVGGNTELIKKYLKAHVGFLEKYGLWVEDFASTPDWVHLTSVPKHKRFFIP